MTWFKRIFFFMLVNLLVVVTLSLIVHLLGIDTRYMTPRGLNLSALVSFCLVWGMGGAFISLAISRMMAKWTMGVKIIKPGEASYSQIQLMEKVHALARKAGIRVMPEVGVYDSPDLNAFATGPTKNRALVAVSSGLLQRMDAEEVEGVLAHEIAHVANGDMVTLTLVQGIINAFVMFFARIVSYAIFSNKDKDGERSGSSMGQFMVTMLLEVVFGFLGMIVVAYFSRWREFRADAGGAKLGGRGKMIAALQRLQASTQLSDFANDSGKMAAFKISSGKSGFLALFSTHPPLEERIARLKSGS